MPAALVDEQPEALAGREAEVLDAVSDGTGLLEHHVRPLQVVGPQQGDVHPREAGVERPHSS